MLPKWAPKEIVAKLEFPLKFISNEFKEAKMMTAMLRMGTTT